MTYFSSDWHLGHKNIIQYDKRPFQNVLEMNETIINNHNSLIQDEDDFYFLGDFSFTNKKITREYLNRINGQLYFIKGNHDYKDTLKLYQEFGTYLGNLSEIKINDQRIVLCHYAMRVWHGSHKGTWHLYGHSHHSLSDNKHSLSIDVGINGWNYFPLSFDHIKTLMNLKNFKSIDHHGT